ncbi:MAG: putative secreted protein [Acidimicrobiales bacterium]|nr:putative secreted protein [Acidimicrobiales bacterium]
MEAWQWVLLAVVVIVIIALGWWSWERRRQRARTLQRFGPEYDRAVEQHGDRREAEADLISRARQRDEIDLRPVTAEARGRYREEWQVIQSRFVDQPEAAITDADRLLDQVMRERGYPIDEWESKADLVSVDHPDVVENYRAARAVQESNATRMASTDDLRRALLHYRSLFDELLEPDTVADEPRGR